MVKEVAQKTIVRSILSFIEREKVKGVEKNKIIQMLQDSPWPRDLIEQALEEAWANSERVVQLEQQYKRLHEKLNLLRQESRSKTVSYVHNKYANRRHFYSQKLQEVAKDQDDSRELQHDSMNEGGSSEEHVSKIQEKINAIRQNASQEHSPRPPEQVIRVIHEEASEQNKSTHFADSVEEHQDKKKGEIGNLSITSISPMDSQGYLEGTISEQPQLIQKINTIHESMSKVTSDPSHKFFNPIIPDKVELVDVPRDNRIQTGITGLDPIIEGGLKPGTATMVAGGPGSGKSTMGLQYLYNGAMHFNQPGIYITFEQQVQALIDTGLMFGWDLQGLMNQNKFMIKEYTPEQVDKMLRAGGGSFRDLIDSMGAKRIVIDSVTAFMLLYNGEIAQRRACLDLFHSLSKWGCTSFVIVEEEHRSGMHKSTVLEYEADAVVILYNERRGDLRQRSLEIFKMRGTKHAGRIFPMKLTSDGLVVYPEQTFD